MTISTLEQKWDEFYPPFKGRYNMFHVKVRDFLRSTVMEHLKPFYAGDAKSYGDGPNKPELMAYFISAMTRYPQVQLSYGVLGNFIDLRTADAVISLPAFETHNVIVEFLIDFPQAQAFMHDQGSLDDQIVINFYGGLSYIDFFHYKNAPDNANGYIKRRLTIDLDTE